MEKIFNSNIPNLLLMVQPNNFGFNKETAASNTFQEKNEIEDTASIANEEFLNAVNILSSHDIEVKVFESENDTVPDSIFPNNWIAQFPGGVLTLFPMMAENRRAEVNPSIVDWVLANTNATKLVDLTSKAQEGKYLEGTGSIVYDHQNKKAFACISPRTNIALFEWYCAQTGYDPISFESLDIKGMQIYHTNVMMAIAQNYAIINLDAIEHQMEKVFCRLELEKCGKKVISISHPQMNNFAANVFEVLNRKGESHLIMSDRAYASFTLDQLAQIREYSTIVKIPIATIERIGGGGIRCMVTGLFR